jgi:large subunit ribosomal protein L24
MSASAVKTKIKKGDTVMVMTGRERGKTGKVLSMLLEDGKVIVEKLNVIKRHTKPNQKVKQGGIIEREAPLALANVMFLCGNCSKPVRVGIKLLDDGRRVRICKKCQEVIERT